MGETLGRGISHVGREETGNPGGSRLWTADPRHLLGSHPRLSGNAEGGPTVNRGEVALSLLVQPVQFAEEGMEAQRGLVICSGSHS